MSIHLSNCPTIYNNKDFKTIQIRLMFPFLEKGEFIPYYQLLPSMLSYMNQKYPTEDLFQRNRKKNYIIHIGCSKIVIGTYGCFLFDLIIPDTYTLNKNLLEDQIKFFSEMIYHPLIQNNGFSPFEFEREVSNLELTIQNALQNMGPYQSIKIRELVDDVGILSRDISKYQDKLHEITPKTLYQFYQDIILNNQPILYIMGNCNNTNIEEICKKYLYLKQFPERNIDIDLNCFLKPRNDILSTSEKLHFKDSSFSVVYKIQDMKKEDRFYLLIVRDLLSSLSSRLLDKKLRDEFDLIYSSKVVSYTHFGILEITAFIHKNHKEEVKEKILEVMKDLENEKLVLPLFNNIKERKRIELLRMLDDKYYLFDEFIIRDLGIDFTKEDYYHFLENVEYSNILKFLKRMVLDTFYFLEEGDL